LCQLCRDVTVIKQGRTGSQAGNIKQRRRFISTFVANKSQFEKNYGGALPRALSKGAMSRDIRGLIATLTYFTLVTNTYYPRFIFERFTKVSQISLYGYSELTPVLGKESVFQIIVPPPISKVLISVQRAIFRYIYYL
jgi:hypothetical protein